MGDSSQPQFDVLLGAHDPADPAEATLVLAALAALVGRRCDGAPTPAAEWARPPTQQRLAVELGLHRGAVRRGVNHLGGRGIVLVARGHVELIAADVLRGRWADHRRRIRLDRVSRSLGLRAEPLLLVSLIAGQVDTRGQLALGLGYLGERLGMARRTLQRTIAIAEAAGGIHRWTAPVGGRGQLMLAIGPSRTGARAESRTGARANADDGMDEAGPAVGREVAHPPSRSGAHHRREVAHPPSRSGARTSGCTPGIHPDHLPDAQRAQTPARPAGDPIQPSAPAPDPSRLTAAQVRAIVEPWVVAMVRAGVERIEGPRVVDLAGLLGQLGPSPAIAGPHAHRRRAALLAERHAWARRVAAWCPSPDRLGRWIVRVAERRGVANLAGYLRRACRQGDPATLLEGAARNEIGRGAEQLRDFGLDVEREIEGPHRTAVAEIVETAAAVVTAPLADESRELLRRVLRTYIASGNVRGAGHMLREKLGQAPADTDLQRVVVGIMTLSAAREAIAVA